MSYYYRGARPKSGHSSFRGRGYAGARGWRHNRDVRSEFDPAFILEVMHHRNYSGTAPTIPTPKVLGGYSVDSNREFVHGKSLLRYLDPQYLPEKRMLKVNIDMKKYLDIFVEYTGKPNDTFENLLRWVISNEHVLLDSSPGKLSVDIVSARSVLTRIMNVPYDKATWMLYATQFKGTVYLQDKERFKQHATATEEPNNIPYMKYGHIFEHVMKGGTAEEKLYTNEEYRCVLTTSFAGNTLLFAPKIDCVDPGEYEEDFETPESIILVKCCRELSNDKNRFNHKRHKLRNLWLENMISGIPRSLMGFRDDDGVVHTIKLVKTDELPEMSEDLWDPNVCFNFFEKFLQFVKERVATDPGATFIFDREYNGHIYCRKSSGPEHNLLPSWYTDGLLADVVPTEDSD